MSEGIECFEGVKGTDSGITDVGLLLTLATLVLVLMTLALEDLCFLVAVALV